LKCARMCAFNLREFYWFRKCAAHVMKCAEMCPNVPNVRI
jgi:hypothetical protein